MMLAFLGLSVSRAVTREEVAEAVWPDSEPELARTSVRTALHALRATLGSDAIQADRQFVWLDQEVVRADLAEFNRLLAEAQLASSDQEQGRLLKLAVGLVRGPMLQEIDAWWLAPHQLAFEESFGQAVSTLVTRLAESGSVDEAVTVGRSALTVTPLRQDIHVALIRSLNLAGRGDEAIRQFEALEALLDEHWGEPPSAEAHAALNVRAVQRAEPAPVLPALRDSLGRVIHGRRALVETTVARLVGPGEDRIVTLHGFGGVGKTTVATAVMDALPDSIQKATVDLVPLRDGSVVALRVAEAFGLKPEGLDTLPEKLIRLLGKRPAVLLLDNAEHLVRPVGEAVSVLIRALPGLRCLVTSRVLLSVPGEVDVPVPLFERPDSSGKLTDVLANPAVALFGARAAAVSPGFAVTSQNVRAVVEICRRLDGLPLAIELAAAQTVLLSPAKLLLRLADTEYALRKLVGEREGRHVSLEHVAAESYALLDTEEQAVWRRLSVFRGSFDLETASQVAGVEDVSPSLARLVGASMLERTMDGDDVRFRFLVPLRSFALRCLEDSSETAAARDRHRVACLAMAERLRPLVDGPRFVEAMREYRRWFDDVLQVVDLAVRDGLGLEEAVQMAERLSLFFVFLGPMREWQVRMMDLVAAARGRVTEMTLARGLVGMGTVCLYNSNWEPAYNGGQEALPILEAHGSRSDTGFACNMIGLSLLFARHVGVRKFDEVEPWLRQCLERVGDKEKPGPGDLWHPGAVASGAYSNLGWLRREQGNGEEAIENLKRGLEIADRHGFVRARPSLLLGVAHALESMDRIEEAYVYALLATEAAEELDMDFFRFTAHMSGWLYCLLLGDVVSAHRHAEAKSSVVGKSGHPHDDVSVLSMLGVTEFLLGSPERGLRNWSLSLRAAETQQNWSAPPRLQWMADIVRAIKPGPPIKMDDPLIVSAMAESMEHFRLAALAQAKERQDQGQHPEGDGQA